MNVGIFIFNDVEVLDMAGPFEVFSLAEKDGKKAFNVFTIAEHNNILTARNGLLLKPNYTLQNHPNLDILIIPGGYGAEHIELKNASILKWVKLQSQKVNFLLSICTGVFILAECGLLNSKKATTHWMDLDRLGKNYPSIEVIRNVKYVDEGSILTSGGISAGIDLSFHLLKRELGPEIASATARQMDYNIRVDAINMPQ
jgi:transcriptional regulator GlxA family with amidase domain